MKLLAKFVLILFPVWAQAQITIDGVMDEPQWMIIGAAYGNNGFGDESNLGVLKYYSTSTTLFLGITGKLKTSLTENHNIVLFIDCDYYNGRGSSTLAGTSTSSLGVFNTANSGSCPTSNGLAGSKMDTDFDLDYAFAFNKGYTTNQFYLDAMSFRNYNLGATGYYEEQFIGATSAPNGQNGDPFIGGVPAWTGSTGQLKFAYKDGHDITNFPNYGIEIEIPYSVTPGIQATKKARFFVLITDNQGYGSNECIPGNPGNTGQPNNNLGCSFDLSTNHNDPSNDIFYTQPWVILPLSFLNNTAKWNNGQALLQWTVLQDFEALQYIIERSANGNSFTTIGTVAAEQLKDFASYSFTDNNPLRGKNFYRIKAIRRNGEPKYSQQATLENTGGSFCIYPNPASGEVTLYCPDLPKGVYPVLISNITGQVVHRSAVYHSSGSLRTTLSLPSLPAGIYSLQLGNDRQLPAQRLVIE